MERIFVDFVGFWKGFNKEDNFIINILKKEYEVVVSDNPQYVFVSSFYEPFEFAKYDCVRIFYTAEPIAPDFSSFDYCIGFDHLSAGDRYFRYPYYALRWVEKELNSAKYQLLDEEKANDIFQEKEYFCNLICSHDTDTNLRKRVFEKISEYKKVDSVGTYLNNQPNGFAVSYGTSKDSFLKKSKFTIAVESLSIPGFTTEKIMEALFMHSIPIYYGDATVTDTFNRDSFIWFDDENNLDSLLEKIIELDQDDDKYMEMLMQQPFIQNDHIEIMNNQFEKFILHIVSQDYEKAFRRVRNYIPLYHDNCLKDYQIKKSELDDIKNRKWYKFMKKLGAIK